MPTDTREKRQRRAKQIADARAILDKADEEKRSLTAEDRQQYDRLWAEQEKLNGEIADEERRNKLELEEQKLKMRQEEEDRRRDAGDENEEEHRTRNPRATDEYRSLFRRYVSARIAPSLETEEFRDLQSDNDEAAGYLVVPEQMASGIIKDLDNLMVVRQLARTIQVPQARKLGMRKRSARASTFQWSAEIQDTSGHKDSSLKVGKKELTPHYLTGALYVSRDLLRAVPDVESFIRDELNYDASVIQETAFMTGNGAEKPLGLFTASADGISTSRDVSTKNTTTAIVADNLLEVKYTLPAQYRTDPTNRWIFSRTAVKQIAQLKDGNGQYLWRMGLQAGQPDLILNSPVIESEYAPSTFTTGKLVGLYGALRYYVIADAMDIETRRLDELKALTNQVVFLCRLKTDALPVLEEAFVRVKLG